MTSWRKIFPMTVLRDTMRQYQDYFRNLTSQSPLRLDQPLVGPFFGDAVFVSIDYEAVCSNAPTEEKLITEFGISWLDTRDLHSAIAGDRGAGLRPFIKDVHFVINENLRPGHGLVAKGANKCKMPFHKGSIFSALFCRFHLLQEAEVRKTIIGLLRSTSWSRGIITGHRHGIETPHAASGTAHFMAFEHAMHAAMELGNSTSAPLTDRIYFFIFHDPREDLKALHQFDIDLTQIFPTAGFIDTQRSILCDRLKKQRPKLEELLSMTGVTYLQLHNGSNDARFTLEAFLAMVFMTEEQEAQFGKTPLDGLPPSWI